MQKKYRIAVLGIGGVGGFLGGKLAAAYSSSEDVEIIFVARGNHAQAIREHGLKLITQTEELIIHPDIITDDAGSAGPVDLLLCCTKTYDLEDSIQSIAASVTAETLILPLLNGVDNTERIQAVLPEAKVLQGCIYLVAKIIAPGVVQQKGEFYSVHFGGTASTAPEVIQLQELLTKANIIALAEDHIQEKIWSKFSFISPIATYTSAYNISIGKILEDDTHSAALQTLMSEVVALARALDIQLAADCIEKNFQVMKNLPYEATSSMQADFAAGKRTELETLTGVVLRKAAEKGVAHDAYTHLYKLLLERQ